MSCERQLPASLRVLSMLRRRVPAFGWDARRVVLACQDFMPYIDVEEVAARCADWLISGQATKVRDPEGTLRAFFERAKANRIDLTSEPPPKLRAYDRLVNRAA